MAKIGEAQITKLNRERLARLKKFIPIRDEFNVGLREDQLLKTAVDEARTKLFKPVTGAVGEVGRKISDVAGEVKKGIGEEVAKITTKLDELKPPVVPVANLVDMDEDELAGAVGGPVDKQVDKQVVKPKARVYNPELIFTDEFKNKVKSEIYDDYARLADLINNSWENRWDTYADNHKTLNLKKKDYAKKIYLLRLGVEKLPNKDRNFDRFYNKLVREEENLPPSYAEAINPFESPMIEPNLSLPVIFPPTPKKRRIVEPQPMSMRGQTGKGIGHNKTMGEVSCGGNILNDVLRLEVLVGGKRAGNNAPGIVNEASDILRRLLRDGIINREVYRSFIHEIVDDYYSD